MVDLAAHFSISLLIGLLMWTVFERKDKRILVRCLIFALLTGFFIDVDHIFDYVMAYGFKVDIPLFFQESYFNYSGRNYVLFHGYEYALILGGLGLFLKNKTQRLYFMIMATALFAHLITDLFLSDGSVRSYFLIYRSLTGFSI